MRNKKPLFLAAIALILILLCSTALAAENEYRTLKNGSEGADVMRLKQAMYWLGYFNNKNLSNYYNATTVERVKQLQKNNGLEETGIATPELQELIFSGNCIPTDTAPKPSPVPTPAPTPIPPQGPKKEVDLPPLTEEGFLSPEAEIEEFVHVDADDGRWIYITSSLAIDLQRWTDKKNTQVWFEGDIRTSEETPMTAYLSNPTSKNPGKGYENPLDLARENKVVLAITDDHFGDRWNGGIRPGVIVRNGKIIKDYTFQDGQGKFPNLEVLAVFEDGSMKTFKSDAHTAQEYLDMGVVNTYAFGPILVENGQLSEYMLRKEYYTYHEPRCSIGMIEPHHYFLLVAKGRTNDSKGVYLTWLADKMMEKGVVEGFNLDGGGTVALMFMGEMLNKSTRNVRQTTSISGFGTSDLVPSK
ncbi:MAG: phosphodiester glycosidase family protein [Clostridia bacterium]|nr:phosphodiester glycosidase family protein [Clostridia bacterium]